MKILYLGYWSVNDGLSQSTVIPNLTILAGFSEVEVIVYVSLERGAQSLPVDFHAKVRHLPFMLSGGMAARAYNELVTLPTWLAAWVRQENIDLIICRGAPAGAIGYLVHQQTSVPYVVESFEPHSAYMRESGVWKWWDPKYLLANWFEEKQKKTAYFLLPVTENYKKQLINEGVAQEILLVSPCAVDPVKFAFSPVDRHTVRHQLGWDDKDLVGVYVGKFGGIYYEQQAFNLFAKFKGLRSSFKLLLVSPQDKLQIVGLLQGIGFEPSDYYVCSLPHTEIASHLSAADFAFSLHSLTPSKIFVSPIKNGEYWANGLPVLLTRGIGDDSDIIKEEGGGVLLDPQFDNVDQAVRQILKKVDQRVQIAQLATKYRSFEKIKKNYCHILQSLNPH